MTPNEKAASFIGEVCDGEVVYVRSQRRFKCKKCKKDNAAYAGWVHGVPDMSRPENYIRALERTIESGFSPALEYHALNNEWIVSLGESSGFERCATTLGEAVIKTLVALYDEEQERKSK